MFKKTTFLRAFSLLLCLSFVSTTNAQKVIAYATYWSGTASDIQYSKITHINYSFAIPDVDGHLKPLQGTSKLQQIVTSAHAVGGKVLIAIGGWSENGTPLDSRFEAIGANATYRTNLVNDAVALVNQYNLDGVDIDWEYPDAGSSANNFEALMTQLYNTLHPNGKLLTAAVGGSSYSGGGINGTVKNVVDWLNVMCYDYNTYQHATYADAVAGIQYYQGKGFPNSQIAMGVPFYGRDSWEAYSVLVGRGADPYADTYAGVGYNGINTIAQKSNYVKDNGLAGVMIWEISQDLNNEYSLVSTIYNTLGTPAGQAPTCALVSPANNSQLLAGSSITLQAIANDADGTISKVEFFDGTTKLGEDLTAPYTYIWNGASTASHSVTVKATDNSGAVTTSSTYTIVLATYGSCTGISAWASKTYYNPGTKCTYGGSAWESLIRHRGVTPSTSATQWKLLYTCGATNAMPTTSVTAPANGSSVAQGTAINITADAADANGTVTKVEFYANGVKLGEDASAPYAFTWSGAAVGQQNIVSKATDNNGFTTTSPVVSITVTGTSNTAPTVSLTSPANNSTYTAPASISIAATASDVDGSISKVDFYNGATLLYSDATSPYSYSWTGVAAGSYSITAKAYDNNNTLTTSSAVSVTVNAAANQAPTVSITSPANNTTYAAGTTSITINTNAADADGSVSSVEFFVNGVSKGIDYVTPFSMSVTGLSAGTYSLTAKATDNSGAQTTSSVVSINIQVSSGGSCSGVASYVAASPYVAGSQVQNIGNLYECKPYPYSGWCSGAAWAYEPGVGAYWADAWNLLGACTASKWGVEGNGLSLNIYPNPVGNEMNLVFASEMYTYVKVDIYNAMGQMMYSDYQRVSLGSSITTLNTADWASGVYFVKVSSNEFSKQYQVVK